MISLTNQFYISILVKKQITSICKCKIPRWKRVHQYSKLSILKKKHQYKAPVQLTLGPSLALNSFLILISPLCLFLFQAWAAKQITKDQMGAELKWIWALQIQESLKAMKILKWEYWLGSKNSDNAFLEYSHTRVRELMLSQVKCQEMVTHLRSQIQFHQLKRNHQTIIETIKISDPNLNL